MKPGYKTSEFWLAVSGQLLSLLVLTGFVSVADKEKIETAVVNSVSALFTLITGATIVWQYIHARTSLKLAHAEGQEERPTILKLTTPSKN